MPTSTEEKYIKNIFLEQQELDDKPVSMGRIAEVMQVVPGTTTTMIKNLAESKLVDYEPRKGVRLTPKGERLALKTIRKQRIVELFLQQIVGLDWSTIHEEADDLEHAISESVLEKIDAMLGHPEVDPHGEPIPTATGHYAPKKLDNLTNCPVQKKLKIARITKQDSAFLKFAESSGLKLGTVLTVKDCNSIAESVTLELEGGRSLSLGMTAAKKIQVQSI